MKNSELTFLFIVYCAKEKTYTRSFTILGFKFSIFVSIILHLLVALLLINTADKPIDKFTNKTKIKPIKSFIYYKAVKNKKDRIATALTSDDKNTALEKTLPIREELPPSIKDVEQKRIDDLERTVNESD